MRDGLLVGVGRDDDLGEDLHDLARGRGVERAVQRDDAAEGRDRIAAQRRCIGLRQRWRLRATPQGLACLMMATAAVRAGSNSATQFEGGVGVVDVVVGQLLALHLPRGGDAEALFAGVR